MDNYSKVREDPKRFVVRTDHVVLDVERVVAEHDGYSVVEKNVVASKVAGTTESSREPPE